MANTLTAIAAPLFEAARITPRLPTGMVDSISINQGVFAGKELAKGEILNVPIYPTSALADFTPSNVFPDGTDFTAESAQLTITKSRKTNPRRLTGEEILYVEHGGTLPDFVKQFVQDGINSLLAECEADACVAAKQGASRAAGAAGTNPFATNLDPLIDARKILLDNGAIGGDLSLVIDSSAGSALRKLGVLQNAYQAGDASQLRSGNFLPYMGMAIKESVGVTTHTKGGGTAYVTSGSTAAGVKDIALVTGSGTVLAGDVVTFAADSANKYVVNTGVAAPGTISLGRPGARVTIATANAMTIGNNFTANIAVNRNAVIGVVRPPKFVEGGVVVGTMPITDPQSGLTFLLVDMIQYGQRVWELHLAWGFKAVNSEGIAVLMG